MKNFIALFLIFTLIMATAACAGSKAGSIQSTPISQSTNGTEIDSVNYDDDDIDPGTSTSEISRISLNGDSITFTGQGATVDGSIVTITSAGTYSISGTLNDGQIRVYTTGDDTVKLLLDGVDITCSNSSPIYAVNAGKTVITLVEGTENHLTDGNSYVIENAADNEPNAAVFSNDDLTINGSGTLIVNANYNNGIQSKDDLKITGGQITVTAVNDGIKGRDSVAIKNGNITLNTGSDGIQSNNDQDAAQGFVTIEGGTISINAETDGIQAETSVTISGGSLTITSGGGSANSSSNTNNNGQTWGQWGTNNTSVTQTSSNSAKGIKAVVDITINGGTLNIDSSDDSLNSNDSLTINGGDLDLSSGDDGIHADTTLGINGGDISISKCYEGIESTLITISSGNIHVISSDDGINVAGGADGSSVDGRPGQNSFTSTGSNSLVINGGYLVVNAGGDGLDVNGLITMTDGTVIVNGPTNSANGALDYTGSFNISGGFLVAAGSSGMAMAPSTTSTQYSVMYNFSTGQPASTILHLENEDGEDILTFAPAKTYQSVVLCCPELKNGSTYLIYSGGRSNGTAVDGLYSDGTYTAGTQVTSFTISNIVTSLGTTGGNMPGGTGGNIGPGGRRR